VYICYNLGLNNIVESLDIKIDEELKYNNSEYDDKPFPKKTTEATQNEERIIEQKENLPQEEIISQKDTKNTSIFFQNTHSKYMIIGDKNTSMETQKILLTGDTEQVHLSLLSKIEKGIVWTKTNS